MATNSNMYKFLILRHHPPPPKKKEAGLLYYYWSASNLHPSQKEELRLKSIYHTSPNDVF